MTAENIICFAKDWSEDPTSNNHVMVELARGHRVLWLNSIATRTPNLASGRDLRKIVNKLVSFFRGPVKVGENMWVYTPVVLPLPHSRRASAVNRGILRTTLRLLRRKLGMDRFQLWTFLPNAVDYVGTLGEDVAVYYCVDEWSKFNYLDGNKIADAEQRLCGKVNVVFATAKSLVDRRLAWNPETHLARHGVDHALFARALLSETPVPDDIATIPKPILGFYGTLQDWVDLDLIAHLAERHPEWSIVLIGKPMVDLSKVSRFKNVHLLGRKPHGALPNYCKAFSVGLIPYVLDERILHVNPIKLREYLCAGLPVVSVDLPEVAEYAHLARIAKSFDEFEAAVADAISTDSDEQRSRRSEAMRDETWQQRVADVMRQVLRVKATRRP